jgi:subtilisin family serine protease
MVVRHLIVLLLSGLMGLGGCSANNPALFGSADELPKQFQDRQILVTLPDALKPRWTAIDHQLRRQHGLVQTGEFPLATIGVDCLVYQASPQQNLDALLNNLRADKNVVLAEKNQIFDGIQSGENDEYASISYAPKQIGADAAHAVATGKGIRIAVVDTGLEKDHPDLRGRVIGTSNFVEGGERSFNHDRHGTAVAGVIAATANNHTGIVGIAPDSEISAYKACWYPGDKGEGARCSSWSLAKSIDAAIQQNVKVINLSLAGPPDQLLAKLLEAASKRGISVVAAALEKHAHPGFPADLPGVIAVISSDTEGAVKAPSWLDELPQVAVAPGVEILTTVPKESYDFVSGSSLATAHVSGIIALLLEIKPSLEPEQIRWLIINANPDGKPSSLKPIDVCSTFARIDSKIHC